MRMVLMSIYLSDQLFPRFIRKQSIQLVTGLEKN